MTRDFSLLTELLTIDSPSGDEYPMIVKLRQILQSLTPSATLIPVGFSLIAVKGVAPTIAVMAHVDTTGFTLGYDAELIPIGSPHPKDEDTVRIVGAPKKEFQIDVKPHHHWSLIGGHELKPGERLVYAADQVIEDSVITAPYLDNRAGLWAAITVLQRLKNGVVAFTSGEEVSGMGARACARYLSETLGVQKVIISDITWDTEHVHIGDGPAISLRDASVPNRRFVDQVVASAEASGIPFQIEIESDGGSDGGHIDDGSFPLDWIFIGAPQSKPHSSKESLSLVDLEQMAELLIHLVGNELLA